MARIKSKPIIDSDSEMESESDVTEKILDSDSENDSEDSGTHGNTSKLNEEPNKDPKDSLNVKLELAKILRKQEFIAKKKHYLAIKCVKWKKVNIEGYSTDELKALLSEIIKSTGVVRTLEEILVEYEKNHVDYDIASHPDYPSRPHNSALIYTVQNREKLTQQLENLYPGKTIVWTDIYKFGSEKFKTLPDKKKEVYIQIYKDSKKAYLKKKEEFFKAHPDLSKQKRASSKMSEEKKKAIEQRKIVEAQKKLRLTPFNQFRKDLTKQGNPVAIKIAQKMWRDLPIEEKGKYIREVMNMESDAVKMISRAEMKIFDDYSGMPKRPITAYQQFTRDFIADLPAGPGRVPKHIVPLAAAKWNSLDPVEKARLQKEADEKMKIWRRKMEVYIKKMPEEQQLMMFSKYKIFPIPSQRTPKKRVFFVQNGKETSENEAETKSEQNGKETSSKEVTTSKKSLKRVIYSDDEASDSDATTKKKSKNNKKSDDEVTPKKKGKIIEESDNDKSPTRKSKTNENLNSEVSPKKKNKTVEKSESEATPTKKSKGNENLNREESPRKKNKTIEESDSFADSEESPTKKSKKNENSNSEVSPKKKSKQDAIVDNSSEKLDKEQTFKKRKMKEPKYPSQSTAHYFMTKIYEGNPHKIAKAYKKLDKKEKLKYRNEMLILRQKFLKKLSKYIPELSSDQAKDFRLKMDELMKQQKEETSWRIDTGTDDEISDSDSSDSS